MLYYAIKGIGIFTDISDLNPKLNIKAFNIRKNAENYMESATEPAESLVPPLMNTMTTVSYEIPQCQLMYTDGACRNWGKPDQSGGYGIYFPERHLGVSIAWDDVSELTTAPPNTNTLELLAIRHCLHIIKHWHFIAPVTIYTDSQYCVNALTKMASMWQKRHWLNSKGDPIQHKDIIMDCFETLAQIYRLVPEFRVNLRIEHVKGHSGDSHNDMADALARYGCDRSDYLRNEKVLCCS